MKSYPLIGLLIVLLIASLACSSGSKTTDVVTGSAIDTTNGQQVWGAFDVTFDTEKGTAELSWKRDTAAHFNVTAFLNPPNCYDCIQIVGSSYDAAASRWYMQLAFRNPTSITGYDVRAVITNLGGNKQLLNPDGITDVWGSPMPFRAINVNPGRAFGPGQVHGRMFDFFFPAGEKWSTLSYIVTGHVPGNVTEPLIENGTGPTLINNGFATTYITAKVFDHQNDLIPSQVLADLTLYGGSPMAQMYDDGAHNDGAAGDGVFGVGGLKTTAAPGYKLINILAIDGQGHIGYGAAMIEVQGGSNPGNDDPVISSVTTSKTTAKAPEKILITVNASDPDGDPLQYEFQCTTGSFSGQNDNKINWTPGSQTGVSIITIKVKDPNGGEVTKQGKLWATSLSLVNGNTNGVCPTVTLNSFSPSKTLNLPADIIGKVTYVNFWATWCGPCVAEMPHLNAMYNKYKDNPDYVQMMVVTSDTQDKAVNFINQNGYKATYWVMDNGFFSKTTPHAGGSNGIPRHLLIDRDGNIRWVRVGSMSSTTELEGYINQLL